MEPLRKLTTEDMISLRDVYRRGLPATVAPYSFIDNHLRWCDKLRHQADQWTVSEVICRDFYTTRGEHDLSLWGTFVSISHDKKSPAVILWTLQKDLSTLREALLRTGLLDFRSSSPGFQCVAIEHYPMVQSVVQERAAPHYQLTFRNSTYFRLPRAVVEKLEHRTNPEGYEFRPLDVSYAREVNDTWPHRYPGSEVYYESLLRLNGGLAVVQRTTDHDELAGWILTNEYGALAHLYIKPAHRQRWLACELVWRWVMALEGRDSDPIAYILDTNQASRTLFQKLGFIEMFPTRWSEPLVDDHHQIS
ncbi:uncharacterized protein LOC128273037 [Anopheles cruzii]|uniref:uncharacterized protein LOC128273037 n=1 Tax=Anopheles cruzii TaxID=68878 RepID=UPI0022EC6CDA|nr:uncharacterized protein LOC128273037 [Anopheles cruzii]